MDFVILLLAFTSLLREGSQLFTDLQVSRDQITLEDARKYCQTKNGRLIILDSQEKWNHFTTHDKYRSYNLNEGKYWTGMQFDESVQCYKNNTWEYNGWARWLTQYGEPSKCPKYRCIRLRNNWMWSSRCNWYYRALCEIGWIDPTPTTTTETNFDSSVATETTTSGTDLSCETCCVSANYSRQLNQQEREEIQHSLRVQLAVNKTDLSAQRRKLISVYDSRPSSVAVGGLACVILVVAVGLIVVPDIITLGRYMYKQF